MMSTDPDGQSQSGTIPAYTSLVLHVQAAIQANYTRVRYDGLSVAEFSCPSPYIPARRSGVQLASSDVSTSAMRKRRRKDLERARAAREHDEDSVYVRDGYQTLLAAGAFSQLKDTILPPVGQASADVPLIRRDTVRDHLVENVGDIECVLHGDDYPNVVIVPAHASFYLGDIACLKELSSGPFKEKFDCILMDPPWFNQSVKRAKRYGMMPELHLRELPIQSIMNPLGALVAVWITNNPSIRRFVLDELFPLWQCAHRATWYWLKVTDSGEPVIPFDPSLASHRRPYEMLLIGITSSMSSRLTQSIPQHLLFCSTPGSKSHSRKPQLAGLLSPYLPPNAACLELFARNLMRGWTSVGNEVLLFQDERGFSNIK